MPALLIRLVMVGLAASCAWSLAGTLDRAAEVATKTYTPFGMIAAGILVGSVGYAVSQFRRK